LETIQHTDTVTLEVMLPNEWPMTVSELIYIGHMRMN